MRVLRRLAVALVFLIVLAGTAYATFRWVERKQTEANLAKQAVEIAAHRQAQRAGPAAAPATAPTATPATPAAPAADSPAAPAVAWTSSWTDFRGARRDGHYPGPIRTDWTALKPLWRQPVGAGFASFVAANGRAFTIEQRGDEEVAAAYDILTGREVWTHAWKASFVENMGGPGPRATPTVHDGTVFVLGAKGELRAIDAESGKLRWRANVVDEAGGGNREYGLASSPLVAGRVVITVPGGGDGRSIVAYDREYGRVAWSALDDKGSYTSPVRATLAGVDQIVVLLTTRVVAVSPDQGTLLWEVPWTQGGDNHAAQPVIIGDDKVFVSSGFGSALIEVARSGERLMAREAWQTHRMKNDFTSSVYHNGFIYGLDLGILACLDASTGELKWKGGRYGNGQTVVASGHLVITTGDGEVVLVRATPESHQELARVPALDDRMWNHPAIADGFLLVRNAAQMAAFDLRVR